MQVSLIHYLNLYLFHFVILHLHLILIHFRMQPMTGYALLHYFIVKKFIVTLQIQMIKYLNYLIHFINFYLMGLYYFLLHHLI